MRAAVVREVDAPPEPGELPDPQRRNGEALVEVLAATLNPIDVKIASGTFYADPPKVPYAPNREGVGLVRKGDRITEGTRVRFKLDSDYGTNGSVAEFVTVDETACMPLSNDVEDDVAAALGIAKIVSWLTLEKANVDGTTVVILDATNASRQIAVQGTKLM